MERMELELRLLAVSSSPPLLEGVGSVGRDDRGLEIHVIRSQTGAETKLWLLYSSQCTATS